jgi:hypothetical protein
MSLFSPGAPFGQSSIMFDGSPAKTLEGAHRPKKMITSKRVNVDIISRSEIISGAMVEVFFRHCFTRASPMMDESLSSMASAQIA